MTIVRTFNATDACGNSSSCVQSVTRSSDPLVIVLCPNQNVTLGYEPQQCALITSAVSGGCQPYSYSWNNAAGSTTPSITVCPGLTTTYVLTVTGANGCVATASHIVTVVDIRCGTHLGTHGSKIGTHGSHAGSGSKGSKAGSHVNCSHQGGRRGSHADKVIMCKPTSHNHSHSHVSSHGSHGTHGSHSHSHASHGSHPSHGTHTSHGQSHSHSSHPSHGATGQCVKVEDVAAKLLQGWQLGPCMGPTFTSTCGEPVSPAPPVCNCKGKITSARLTYLGTGPVTIRVYKASNHTQLINTFTNVTTGTLLNITASPNLPDKIYIEVVGDPNCDTRVNTKCGQLVAGDRIAHFDVTGWSDNNGHHCNGTATPLKAEEEQAASATESETRLTAYPNPFNEATTVEFSVNESQGVVLKVFNLAGAEIATLFEGEAEAGAIYKLSFKPENAASGIYISKLVTSSGEVKFEKLVLQQ